MRGISHIDEAALGIGTLKKEGLRENPGILESLIRALRLRWREDMGGIP
jgi:hypothetical protein